MNGRMDGWMDGRKDGRTDGWTDILMNEQTNGWRDGFCFHTSCLFEMAGGLCVRVERVLMAGDMLISLPGDPSADWMRVTLGSNRHSGIRSCCCM